MQYLSEASSYPNGAKIIIILKTDKPAEFAESYRPISLLRVETIREISTYKALCNNEEI